jgi:hypothetical protein
LPKNEARVNGSPTATSGIRGRGGGEYGCADGGVQALDVSGRKVLDLGPGANDVRALAPGAYFVREAQAQAQAQAVRKVIKLE